MRVRIEGIEVNAAMVALAITGTDQIETMRTARDLINRLDGTEGVVFEKHDPLRRMLNNKFVMNVVFRDKQEEEGELS